MLMECTFSNKKNMTVPKFINTIDAVARLYKEDYHELFSDSKSAGIGEAIILIN